MTQEETSPRKAETSPNAESNPLPNSSPPNGKNTKRKKGGNNSLWLILAVVFGTIFVWNHLFEIQRHEIPIMQLIRLIEQGNPKRAENATDPSAPDPSITVIEGKGKSVRKVVYSDLADVRITPYEVRGTVTRRVIGDDPKQSLTETKTDFFSGRQGLSDDNNELFNRLKEGGFDDVRAQGPPNFIEKNGFFLISTALCLFALLFIIQKVGSGAMAFGRNRDIQVAQEDIHVSFSDVAGVDEAVDELREIVEFLKTPEKFRTLGGRIPKGVLLVGPPGTGKTLLAKAVAGEANVPFFSLSGSDFVEIYAGVGAARVRDLFQQAEKSSPCIIFIDELDALGRSRSGTSIGGAHDEREQTLNALLVEMDGFGTNSGTIVMAATNRPEILDSALLRSGRFDRQVLVDRPDIQGREEILKIHSLNVKLAPGLDLHQIASITSGFVGADLEALVNEAALLAARAGKESVTMEEFTEGVERVTTGLEKRKRVITEGEKIRVSHHECGHALMARLLPNADPVHKISIIPRGIAALGYTLQRPDDERYLMTQSELEDRIRILLAGTAAEEILFSDISTGAQNDLERATELARNMVMSFGMSRLGRVSYHESPRSWIGDSGFVGAREFSEKTAWEIDQEIKSIIDRLYQETLETLSGRRPLLERLAARLLEKEVIDAAELDEVIASFSENVPDRHDGCS